MLHFIVHLFLIFTIPYVSTVIIQKVVDLHLLNLRKRQKAEYCFQKPKGLTVQFSLVFRKFFLYYRNIVKTVYISQPLSFSYIKMMTYVNFLLDLSHFNRRVTGGLRS